jgi:glycosyltransferase involved in cell wall biosynthesis
MQPRVKVTLAVSGIHRAVSHEWTIDYMNRGLFDFSFVLLNSRQSAMEAFLKDRQVPYLLAGLHAKKDLPGTVWNIHRFLRRQRTQVIHTHLFEANLAGLAAARLAGVRKRIYTRHHSTIHHVYFPAAVRYDRLVNRLATAVVAVSDGVRDVLVARERVPERKVHVIPHGFRFEAFDEVTPQRVEALREKYGLGGKRPVVGVVSRYTDWKGVQYIVPAFRRLLAEYPGAVLVLANAQGDYAAAIQRLLAELDPSRYVEIPFEADFAALYKLFDVFVHAPIDDHSEAFGQTYVEAPACGLPCVFTLSGIAPAFIRHLENAWVADYRNPDQLYAGLRGLLGDPALAARLAARGNADVRALFPLHRMLAAFEKLYTG